ncbi:MAG: hypothetical protein AB7T22_04990 [Calditrichaceae bacterium]
MIYQDRGGLEEIESKKRKVRTLRVKRVRVKIRGAMLAPKKKELRKEGSTIVLLKSSER